MVDILKKITNPNFLQGDFLRISEDIIRGKDVVATGLNEPMRALLSASITHPVIYVAGDSISAKTMYKTISEFCDDCIYLPEKYDFLTYKPTLNLSSSAPRIKAIFDIIKGNFKVAVVTIESLMQFFPNKDLFLSCTLTLKKDATVDYQAIISQLISMGYARVDKTENKAEFAVYGDIIDIFPIDSDLPLRIMLFDDQIEAIKQFAPDSMMINAELTEYSFLPICDMIAERQDIERALKQADIQIDTYSKKSRLREIFEDISLRLSTINVSEALWWLAPFFKNKLSTIADIINEETVIFYEEARLIDDKARLINNELKARIKNLVKEEEILPIHSEFFVNKDTVYEVLSKNRKIATMPPTTLNPIFSTYNIYNFKSVAIPRYYMNRAQLLEDLRAYSISNYTVLVCTGDINKASAYQKSLFSDDIGSKVVEADKIYEPKGIIVTDLNITKGFILHASKLVVIGVSEVLRTNIQLKGEKKKKSVFTMPEAGDFVVHDVHGIGLCEGIKRIKGTNFERDYIVIKYKNEDILYVPVENMDNLSRFSGSEGSPALSRLGGSDFNKIKQKVKKDIKEMAINLLDLYSKRSVANGFKYSIDTVWQEEFEDDFPYNETQDQLDAVNDLKRDLEQGKIMDRLICGDVGYGKTEVALRAAFKVAIEGKQVAFLAPTTILALQHYNNLKDRFNKYGVKCDLMCRFKTNTEIKASIDKLKSGDTDLVVGTHRLLSKDVEFKDLGLLILDEEQRFGVEHKEKIQSLRNNINVLSMSATPIPRTLNMALNGIRDISVLETPPSDRQPIQTFVTEYSDALISDAVSRELARGGQVFILYNRVETIYSFADKIKSLTENAEIRIANGQMKTNELEISIADFYSKKANILICTTIIQNGIDLPDANTMIIIDADRLGLSELYQLRGRVGRSNRLAYAYFTVKEEKVISENAIKRLSAIMDYTDFGSGFKIAMRDLEIRGAGNILGKEQHGHISKVGYEMYCTLLEDSVSELKGNAVVESIETEMAVDIDGYVNEEYAKLLGGKMRIYKKISEINSEEEKQRMIKEFTDKGGQEIPQSLYNLMNIALAKSYASRLKIKKVIINVKNTALIFNDNNSLKNPDIFETVSNNSKIATLTMSDTPTVCFYPLGGNSKEKLKIIIQFLEQCLKLK